MEAAEMKSIAQGVLENAADINDKDTVMSAMFAAGIPFGKLNYLYTKVGIELKLLVDPAELKEKISDELTEHDFSNLESWAEVEDRIAEIVAVVDGSTDAKVLRAIRAHCKDEFIELPKQEKEAKTSTRAGKLVTTIADYVNGTDEPTIQGMYEALVPNVKTPKNASDYSKTYIVLCVSIKYGISVPEAVAKVKAMGKIKSGKVEETTEEEMA